MRIDEVFAAQPKFIGVITPSGNTVVERVTQAIVANFPGVSSLFSRTPVFGESDPFPKSYGVGDMLTAAKLLAHAKPDVLVWNGSKGAKINRLGSTSARLASARRLACERGWPSRSHSTASARARSASIQMPNMSRRSL